MKPEKKKKIREGDTMPLSPKGKRGVRRVSRRNNRQALQGHIGVYIIRNDPEEDNYAD